MNNNHRGWNCQYYAPKLYHELSRITQGGKTRLQLEKEIKDLQDEIFKIEAESRNSEKSDVAAELRPIRSNS